MVKFFKTVFAYCLAIFSALLSEQIIKNILIEPCLFLGFYSCITLGLSWIFVKSALALVIVSIPFLGMYVILKLLNKYTLMNVIITAVILECIYGVFFIKMLVYTPTYEAKYFLLFALAGVISGFVFWAVDTLNVDDLRRN